MVTDTNALAALIGSRICHDLISPIGAVNNGLELLELSGTIPSPELTLVTESVASANARIRFFRLAFGVASKGQETGSDEINAILSEMNADDRTKINDFPDGLFPRTEVRAVLLALLCAEQAAAYGGEVTIENLADMWILRASAERLNTDAELWAHLNGKRVPFLPAPAFVQFLMLPTAAAEANLKCSAHLHETKAEIRLKRA